MKNLLVIVYIVKTLSKCLYLMQYYNPIATL